MTHFYLRLQVLILLYLLPHLQVPAQRNQWRELPNKGFDISAPCLPSVARVEDVFFTDSLNGYTVSLTGYILKTRDGGVSWSGSRHQTSTECIRFRCIEFLSDAATGIAGSVNGYTYRTEDSGNTWKDITFDFLDTLAGYNARETCGLSHWGDNFYGIGWWGSNVAKFYKSVDKGKTWTVKYIDTSLATCLVDIHFVSKDTGFVTGGKKGYGTWNKSNQAVILKTCDGGNTWARVFYDKTIGGRIWKIQYVNKDLMVGSVEPYYYPDTVCMVKSTDGGNTWSMIHAGSFHDITHSTGNIIQGIGFATPQKGWLSGYFSGLWETIDGGESWKLIPFGTNTNRIFVIDSNTVYGGGKSIYKWGSVSDNSDTPRSALPVTNNQLYPIRPNPARGIIEIKFDLGVESNVMLEIVNIEGQRVERLASGRFKPGTYTYQWDSGNWPNGNYVVWLDTDEIPIARKFVLIN